VSLDNIMDSITLHSSAMFLDLALSLRWNPARASSWVCVSPEGTTATLRAPSGYDGFLGQATVLGVREYAKTEVRGE
jgi:hypothetical protein